MKKGKSAIKREFVADSLFSEIKPRFMTNKEAIDRWAEYIIPAVFKAEDALQKAKPEWKEKLANVSKENGALLARLYCEEIATIIVKMGSDYEPDGSIDGEMDYIENA